MIVYRVPRLTIFAKLPDGKPNGLGEAASHRFASLSGTSRSICYFTSACLGSASMSSSRRDSTSSMRTTLPTRWFVVAAVHKLLGRKSVFDHHDLSPELYLSRYRTNTEGLVTRGLRLLREAVGEVCGCGHRDERELPGHRHRTKRAAPERVFIVRNGPDANRVRLTEPDARLRSMNKKILGLSRGDEPAGRCGPPARRPVAPLARSEARQISIAS